MTYSEIVFTVDSSVVDKASAIVSMLDCGGVYIEDYTDLEDDPTVKQVGIVAEELLNKDKSYSLSPPTIMPIRGSSIISRQR